MFKEGQQVVWATWVGETVWYYLRNIVSETNDCVVISSRHFDKHTGIEVQGEGSKDDFLLEPNAETLSLVEETELKFLHEQMRHIIDVVSLTAGQVRAICAILENIPVLTINWREVPDGYTSLGFNGKDWFATGLSRNVIGNPRENKGIAQQYWFQPLSGEPETWERPQ